MDTHLIEALKWLENKTRTIYSQEEFSWGEIVSLGLHEVHSRKDIDSSKYVLIHKGKITEIDPSTLMQYVGRSEICFSNDVYIVLRIFDISEKGDSIKSFFYNMADCLHVDTTPSKAIHRMCQYIGEKTVLTETFFGRKIFLDSMDISLTPHIMAEGRWEPWVTTFLQKNLKKGDVFFDIGANCGFYTLLAAHIVGEQGFVLGAEPQIALHSRLIKSVAVNGFSGFVEVANVALGDERKEVHINKIGDYVGSATLLDVEGSHRSERVNVTTMPLLIQDVERKFKRKVSPNFIKIDVEGYEINVWKGMRNWLKEQEGLTIVMEFSPIAYKEMGQDPHSFVGEILEAGFSINRLLHNGTEVHFSSSSVDDVISSGDYVDLILRRQ
ncbi:FkbM family methyltransferase [Agrobacterium tumefaciens]